MLLRKGDRLPPDFFSGAVARIRDLQRDNGAIPWYDGGVYDPWNHTEAAMGLGVLGEIEAARKAFRHLAETQAEDGSWIGEIGAAAPVGEDAHVHAEERKAKPVRDTNFIAYIATGAWHHYLLTDDKRWLAEQWPHIEAAINFVLSWQTAHGDIRWAADDPETPEDDALVTGCASTFKSLECAIAIARVLGRDCADWIAARERLGTALRERPDRFDRTWEPKDRFSMDWYYPVLAGALTGKTAQQRLAETWKIFVEEGHGCRCVREEPWVTVAESCELAMAFLAIGDRAKAEALFSWQHQWRDDDGAYWMGFQFQEKVVWPEEKPAWTAAAAILAADAVLDLTPAARLFGPIALAEAAE